MNLTALLEKRDYYQANKDKISEAVRRNYDANFEIEYAHNSTAIEGNTLSLPEVTFLLGLTAEEFDSYISIRKNSELTAE